jgi:phosphatidylglycerophosphate synthase
MYQTRGTPNFAAESAEVREADKGTARNRVERFNRSIIAWGERKLIAAILPRIPDSVLPLHLTLFGLLGGVGTAAALVLCNLSRSYVVLVPIGLLIHWFGDSLDGSLARYRGTERPAFGFLVDHTADLLAMTAILVGFGLSPYLTPVSALLVLVMYLLFSSYTYIRVAVESVHQMSYGGLGATEFRFAMAVWALGAAYLQPRLDTPGAFGLFWIDICVGILSFFAFVALSVLACRDAARLAGAQPAGASGPRPL